MNYKTICIILARGGSKGIPNKNLKKINGVSLVRRAVNSAIESKIFDQIIVSSDEKKILSECSHKLVSLHLRSVKTASDNATSESALVEVLNYFQIDNGRMFFVQCTTPLITSLDYLNIQALTLENPDNTIISGYAENIHHWVMHGDEKTIYPILDSDKLRQPRQGTRSKVFVENGGIYSTLISEFLLSKNRFNKNVTGYIMAKIDSHDIDDVADLEIVRTILRGRE
jgi:CMP-N-acetylneuraminic acid synthetase